MEEWIAVKAGWQMHTGGQRGHLEFSGTCEWLCPCFRVMPVYQPANGALMWPGYWAGRMCIALCAAFRWGMFLTGEGTHQSPA